MSISYGGSPPEILIGLSYSAPTGRLCVQVIKGSHFRNLAMSRPPGEILRLAKRITAMLRTELFQIALFRHIREVVTFELRLSGDVSK